jgi:hypothetical protein
MSEDREKQRLIAEIEKNSIEVVRIHLQSWKSQRYVDIRIWRQIRPGDGEAAAQPTIKGITLNVDLLSELRAAIDKALAEVEVEDSREVAEDSEV